MLSQLDELKSLSQYFPADKKLYAVGGCVRDALRGKEFFDIDLTGEATPQELEQILSNTPYQVHSASPKLGTMIIKGKRNYEYTTFRIDSYPKNSGLHTPSKVEFTRDIYADACRRDFKCNAIYYDIANSRIVDPLDGQKDIQNKVLSTTVAPDKVLGEDGLRIMRLLRFVSQLGFEVEKNTLESAKNLVANLKDISVERIRDELDKLLLGDYCYEALHMARDIGVLSIILPELASNDKVAQKPQFHKYDVLEHIFQVVKNCPPNIRLAGLFHDIAKGVCQQNDGNTYMHASVGAKMTRDIMTKYKYPNKEIDRITRLVEGHMFDVNGNAREIKFRQFIAKYYDIIDDMLALFDADSIGTGYYEDSRTATKMRIILNQMKENNTAFNVSMLNINGKDLQKLGFEGKAIGEEMRRLVDLSIRGLITNDRQELIKLAKKKADFLNKKQSCDKKPIA